MGQPQRKERDLTAKQKRFIEEYLVDLNGAQAALRCGYNPKSARDAAHDNLRSPRIAEAVRKALAERTERTKIDADWVLNRLAAEAEADLADLYDEKGKMLPIKQWPPIWRKGLIVGLSSRTFKGKTTLKAKISERLKRIELIGRHINVGAFVDKHEHTGKGGVPLIPETATDTEIARRVAYLLAQGIQAQQESNHG